MSGARKLLIFGGLALAGFGMFYGLYYALFVEHQTLESMGSALTEAFVNAAERHLAESSAAIDRYSQTKYVYVRQVDVHSHWVGLAMLLIGLGVVLDSVSFPDRVRLLIALAMLTGAVLFPLGVLLQTGLQGPLPSALAIMGSALVIVALAMSAVGFARQGSVHQSH